MEPAGLTRVTKKDIKINGLDCIVTLDLKYQAKGAKHPVLQERRVVQVDTPDAKGGYIITVKHRFTTNEDVVLNRVPLNGDPAKGRWSGGYVGPTLRLAADVAVAFKVRGFSGGKSAAEFSQRGFTEKWFSDFIKKYHGDLATETVSFDSAPISARAKVVNAKKRLEQFDPDQPEPPSRLE